MAEMRTPGEGTPRLRSDVRTQENLGYRPADHLPSGHALPGSDPGRMDATEVVTDDPQVVRAEIEHTRERMSETIGEIEGVLARKREQLQDRLDVLAPIRERPLPAAGIAFGAGLVLGLLTGGDEEERESHPRERSFRMDEEAHDHFVADVEDRARMWEARARRLLQVARDQEEQIRELQERYGDLYARDVDLRGWDHEQSHDDGFASGISDFRETVMHGLTNFLTDAFRQVGRGGEDDARRA